MDMPKLCVKTLLCSCSLHGASTKDLLWVWFLIIAVFCKSRHHWIYKNIKDAIFSLGSCANKIWQNTGHIRTLFFFQGKESFVKTSHYARYDTHVAQDSIYSRMPILQCIVLITTFDYEPVCYFIDDLWCFSMMWHQSCLNKCCSWLELIHLSHSH